MADSGAAPEPSMEEILSSIRQIISDDTGEEEAPRSSSEAKIDIEPVESEEMVTPPAADDGELSQDDLDKLFEGDFDENEPDASGLEELSEHPEANEDISDAEIEALLDSLDSNEEILDGGDNEEEDILELTGELRLLSEEESEDGTDDIVDPVAEALYFAEPSKEPVPSDEITEEPEPQLEPEEPELKSEPIPAGAEKANFAPAIDYTPVNEFAADSELNYEKPLISNMTDEVVTNAFDHLSHMIVATKARTMEDLMQDMLRPMLKAWLDTNLPPLVEDLVKKEIERVTRRRL